MYQEMCKIRPDNACLIAQHAKSDSFQELGSDQEYQSKKKPAPTDRNRLKRSKHINPGEKEHKKKKL